MVLANNKEQHAVSESTRVSRGTSIADEVHHHKALNAGPPMLRLMRAGAKTKRISLLMR